jgi:HD-GYP domain-containing protein (c-di-GMP phosphodiesterase class II)
MNLTELRQAVKEELETKTAINNLTSGKAKEGFKQLQQLFSDAEELQAYLNSEEGPLPLAINAFLEKFGLESDPQHKQIFQFENTFHKKPKLTKTKLKQIIREELKQVLLETKEDYSKILRDLFYQFNSALIEVKKLSDEDLHKDSVTRFYRDLRKIRIKLEDAENVGKVALCTKWKKRAYELSLELLSILDDLEKDAIRNGPNWFFPAPIDYRDVHSKIKKITNALAPSIGPNGEKVFPCGYAVDDSRPRKKSKIYKYNDSLNRKQ